MPLVQILVVLGALLAAGGLFGLFHCVRLARRVKAGQVPEAELQSVFARLSAINMASMGAAMFGLSLVLIGLIL